MVEHNLFYHILALYSILEYSTENKLMLNVLKIHDLINYDKT